MFVVTVEFTVQSQFCDNFTRLVCQQAARSLQGEPACHVFDVSQAADDTRIFFLYEKYTDSAAFDEHLKSEHFVEFDRNVRDWLQNKTVSTWWELSHE